MFTYPVSFFVAQEVGQTLVPRGAIPGKREVDPFIDQLGGVSRPRLASRTVVGSRARRATVVPGRSTADIQQTAVRLGRRERRSRGEQRWVPKKIVMVERIHRLQSLVLIQPIQLLRGEFEHFRRHIPCGPFFATNSKLTRSRIMILKCHL